MLKNNRHILITAAALFVFCLGLLLMGNGRSAIFLADAASADKPLRLHVLANSDDADDQQIKLATRDYIIGSLEDLLADAADKRQAIEAISAALPELTAECNRFLSDKADYQAELRLETADFPEIDYGGAVFAAGEYDALRILLGEAEGKNWWCVLFPPLCFVDLAGEYQPDAVEAMAGAELKADNDGGYRVEWKLARLFQ